MSNGVALAVVVAAPVLAAFGVDRIASTRPVSVRRALRVRAGTSTLTVGVSTFVIFAGIGDVSRALVPAAGFVIGFLAILFAFAAAAARRTAENGRLAERLRDPTARAAAIEELRAQVASERERYRDGSWCSTVIEVAPVLAHAGLESEIEELLRCDPPPTAPTIRAAHAFWTAYLAIRRGDGDRARSALRTVSRDAARQWASDLAWVTALVDAVDGAPEAALAVAGEETAPHWMVVRAHALAAKGDRENALRELRRMREANLHVIAGVARGELPAAALARSLAREEHPFR